MLGCVVILLITIVVQFHCVCTPFISYLQVTHIPRVRACPEFLALTDSFVHATIGFLSWAIVDPASIFQLKPQLFVVGLGSAFIDIDHFLAARSLRVAEVLKAPYRGVFHCSGLFILFTLCLVPVNLNYALILILVSLPHHLRDSTRRGLYLYFPYVHTKPLPKFLVQCLLVFIPWLIMLIRTKYVGNALTTKTGSSAFVV